MVIWGKQETPVGFDRICSMNCLGYLLLDILELSLAKTVVLKLWVATPRVQKNPFMGWPKTIGKHRYLQYVS